MENIEVEIRSFITQKQYFLLLKFFQKKGKFIGEDFQETYYLDNPQDLRIQKNQKGAKIWLKTGQIHDEAREELEVFFKKGDFGKIEKLFKLLGMGVKIKWLRKRYELLWEEIKVCLDDTKGYGFIIELEIMSSEKEKEKNLLMLKEKLKKLKIELTPKEEFDKKFKYYQQNWQKLI